MSDLTIQPITSPFTATITPPGSKSLTNRALVLAAMADGTSELSNVLFADDTRAMLECLVNLGFAISVDEPAHRVTVRGARGEIPRGEAKLFCNNSGTTIRFLSALCSLGKGNFLLDGNDRMRQRPIGQLVEMLRNLGVRVKYERNGGFPPVRILADHFPGGLLRFGSSQSSQYLSAILMVAPYARHEVKIDLDRPQTSWPYVAMTMQLMDHFHLTPELIRDPLTGEPVRVIVPQGKYKGLSYAIEPDASNASYFLAAAAIRPGAKVTIEGLGRRSLQGDVRFADLLHRMGAGLVFGKDFITVIGAESLEGLDVSMADMPDMAQTLAVIALFARGQTRLRGIHTLRVKETDRVAALASELTKLGAAVTVEGDDLIIAPPSHIRPAKIETYDDHRMAMSFGVAGTRVEGVTITNVECVNKTYPRFFADLGKLGAGLAT